MQDKRKGLISKVIGQISQANRDSFNDGAASGGHLGYKKGNLEQNGLKNAGVWDSCPVLDETGCPVVDLQDGKG